MKRFPNTPHWQRAVSVGKSIYGRGWRRGMEKFFSIEPGRLRATIDREGVTEAQIGGGDDHLMRILAHYEKLAAARGAHLAGMREKISADRDYRERHREVKGAVEASGDFEWPWLYDGLGMGDYARKHWPEMFVEYDKKHQEAA
jgi:hypothetical protein